LCAILQLKFASDLEGTFAPIKRKEPFMRLIYQTTSFLFLLLLCATSSLWAQAPAPPEQSANLTGRVIDADNGQGLEYASLRLYNLPDSTPAGGGLSDKEGNFTLQNKPGTYYLVVSSLGYEKQTFSDIVVKRGRGNDLGNLKLTSAAVSIDGVDIEAQGAQMQLKLDKRVFKVSQDLSLAGGGADEVLQNLPSVNVDAEGGISLRGSQSVRVLINGKPSGLLGIGDGTDGLQNLPANMIEKVEVITNPSARYDAEGEVGIINIILKKEDRGGFNGSFNVGTGWPHNHQLGANLNYRSGKVNFFANLSGEYDENPGGGFSYQENYRADTTFITERDRTHLRQDIGGRLRLGADFQISEHDVLTLYGLLGYSDGNNRTDIRYRDLNADGSVALTTDRLQNEREIDENLEFSATYKKTYEQKGREWTTILQWQDNDDNEDADIIQSNSLPGSGPLLQRSINQEDEANWLFQTDYVHPFGKGMKVETGAKSTLRTIENNYLVEERNLEGNFMPIPGFDNGFLYLENIYAAYGIFSQELNKFSYQFGLRAEYSDIGADTLAGGEFVDYFRKRYLNWFPSAFFSYKLNGKNTIQLSYSRRLSRPRFRRLLPFSNYSDNRNLRLGNPDLDPEYTNSFELGYLAYWENGSLLSSVYYRQRNGVIERITVPQREGSENAYVTFPVNLATQDAVGFELSGSQDIFDWWSLSGNLNAYGAETQGNYEGQEFFARTLAFNARLNSRMNLPANMRFQASFDYRAPQREPQGRRLAIYSIDLGLSKTILKGKGTLNFSVRDLLNSRRWRSETIGDTFFQYSEFQWRRRSFTLTFNYRLNQEDRGRRDMGDRDDY
jgi:outer membrane receptor protein involved in Fe transport